MKRSVFNNLEAFAVFAKGQIVKKEKNTNCVIYTRVSSKEQTKGMSLEIQRKECEQYALRNKIPIMGYFGGTYESAKTDERKEFNRMLVFVKKSNEEISIIIVYSVDRFSRSGANAVYIADQLKQQGISVFAVTQPTDTTTPNGSFQQNIQFIFSEYDNQLRREKCMAGVREKLLTGIWCTRVPIGYDILRRDGLPKQITLNWKGKLVNYAFELRLAGLTNEEVRRQLSMRGFNLSSQRISDMFRNPFYCGLITHKALEGKIIEGIQEPAVSKDLFLKVTSILLGKQKPKYSVTLSNEETPLKRFIKCDQCGQFLRAYKAKKNQQYYYKCNTRGCHCNKRADELLQMFKTVLNDYVLGARDKGIEDVISGQVIDIRINPPGCGEELQNEWEQIEFDLPSSSIMMRNAIDFSAKLSTIWNFSNYRKRLGLQFLVFPEGLYYNRKTDKYRIPRVNEAIFYISDWYKKLSLENRSDLNIESLPEKTFHKSWKRFMSSLAAINNYIEANNLKG
jgi:site-specific DNA recombinase